MSATVSRPLRTKAVTPKNLSYWARDELLPFLAEVRQSLNYIARQQATLVTAGDATFHTIWTSSDLAVGTVVRLDSYIIGCTSAARSAFTVTGTFYNDGTTAQEGPTVAGYTRNTPGYTVRYLVVSNHVELQVEDAGGTSVNWTAVIDAQEAP